MKIDRTRLKKSNSEVPAECQALIDKLRSCTNSELLEELKVIDAWTFGKCELFHWIDILDIFDSILEEGAKQITPHNWILNCDLPENQEVKVLLLWILRFTTLLIEHSFSRHLYNSVEHLIALLSSCDMNVVLAVLNLLYMFSKRSNFLQRINNEKRAALIQRLTYLAENWGARHGYSLSNCVDNKPINEYPPETTTMHYEYYAEVPETIQTVSGKFKPYSSSPVVIHIEKLHTLNKTPAEIMNDIVLRYPPPRDKQVLIMLFTYIRSAVNFPNYPVRLLCVQARLQALSVLAYSNALAECAHTLLYEGLVEELRNVLHIAVDDQVEIRASAVRTLTSIIHLDRNPHFPKKSGSRLSMIIDVTGASSYHGFLPTLTRSCIYDLICGGDSKYEFFPPLGFRVEKYSLPLATSLFSFLYHLASYEAGGEALVSCGMMDSLLQVIDWPGHELEHITFVTRAVRVIDLITNIEMQGFQARGGLASFITRLDMEVHICRKEQTFEIPTADTAAADEDMRLSENKSPVLEEMDIEQNVNRESAVSLPSLSEGSHASSADGEDLILRRQREYEAAKSGKMCLPQRAALLKSMLNFLKKAIQDTSFADSIRHIMDGSLPSSLRHIISNAEYYGPSLFLLATDVVTVYVFQEPSLLSSLQDNGLTHVVLEALLVKDVPATREVLGSLPNVFSALCLNDRGLAQFIVCNPFESLFKVLLSPVYLGAMRRRRTTDPIGDTASNLGNAMDELMRHQPTLKSSATCAIIKLLEELCELGRDPKYVCWRAQNRLDVSPTPAPRPTTSNEGGSSDEEEEDEEEASTSSQTHREETSTDTTSQNERQPVALLDYIINVMKFVDAILSNNSTDDHCREFVAQKGLPPLMSILGLPNLPVDYPVTAAAQSVATVCKSILNLSHEPQVLKIGLMQLSVVLDLLKPLHCPIEDSGSSILLHELAAAPNLETAFSSASATPLLHAMSAAHGYVVMFIHVCRTGQTEIRSLSISHWASELGLSVLRGLAKLYSSLVWESTLLLALCSDDIIPAGSTFGKDDLEKLLPSELRNDDSGPWRCTPHEGNSNGAALEAMNTDDDIQVIVEECGFKSREGSRQLPSAAQLKYIKPLLGASSRLGRALAELFGLLVKLCVGSPMRQRRGQPLATSTPLVPSPPARSVAAALADLLVDSLNWKLLPSTHITKFKFTFLICSVGFTSPMLGDEKKCAYHLMLQRFGSLGFTAFLEAFYWAISGGHKFDAYSGLEHPALPEGTGEFLDAWLLLLEKLVNPKNVLESPHSISVKHGIGYKPFDAVLYMHKIHQRAFMAIGHLWGKKPLKHYGPRMSDTMMSIYKHILRGEKIWLEYCKKNKDRTSQPGESIVGSSSSSQNISGEPGSSGSNTSRRPVDLDAPEPEINQEALNQLMDMGFSRDHCIEALLHTSSVEQATEYLLTYPLTQARSTHQSSMDIDLTEEDQMSRAISLSLGEKIPPEFHDKENQKHSVECGMELDESLLIDKFTEHVLKDCLMLMDEVPDTVFRSCELLVAVAKRNGKTWCFEMLSDLTFEIATRIYYMIGIMESPRVKPVEVVTELVESDAAVKAAVRIHLFTLLFEGPLEMRQACIEVVEQTCINEGCCQLLIKAQKFIAAIGQSWPTPKWMAPLILLIDLFEKVAVITHRKNEMLKVTNSVWRWFDLTSGKWTAYSVVNNKLINEAYWNGESAVRLNCGRRRYVIHFNYMIQTNEESGSRRPVTMSLTCREKIEGKDYPARSEKKDDKEVEKMDSDHTEDERRKKFKKMKSVGRDIQEELIRACVGILPTTTTDTLHAAMRLCLRLSRNYENARTFSKLGGVKCLLNLTRTSSFGGFQELATMLMRHAIEEPVTLRHAMEKVIRTRTLPNIPPPYKEILYLMRNTSSCVCRDPNAYLEVACDILRCDLNLLPKRTEGDDPRLLVKTQQTRWNTALVMQDDAAVQVICELLNALTRVVPCSERIDDPEPEKEKHSGKKNIYCSYNVLPVHNTLMHRYPGDPLLPDAIEDREQNDSTNNSQKSSTNEEGDNSVQVPSRGSEKSGPLLPKSSILKILADAVRSYSACAKLIIEHTYHAGISELVTEDCTALAFILDKLIPINENQVDRECQCTARMLISAIASCNHTPDAQTTLVCELKGALLRSLAMPESVEKHTRISNLSAIILHTIENCPPLVNQSQTQSVKLHQYSSNVNNIVKVMLRKGLLIDLARITHYMDLSSSQVVNSVNAVLKPLETLSRIVNQPSTSAPSKTGKVKPQIHGNGSAEHTGTTTSEATHAQGEEAVEDAENTDHDISGTAESLEPISESQLQEDVVDDAVLDDVMDQLLERDGVGSNEENMLNASFTVEPEAQTNRMDTDDVHTPPIRNQTSLPYGNEDDDAQDVERVQSSDSDSGSNPSDDPDEVNNVDDEEDDEDEDEGDDNEDEGGSGYDEDGLEFFESDDGLFRIPGLDRENEDILMIQYSDPDLAGPVPHVPWNSNSFPIPLGLFEDPTNGNDASGNRLTPNHPLLTARHPSETNNLTGPRSQRGNRPRRYQYLQLNGRSPNPPVILQRLLGPGNHDLSITTNQAGYRDATRVVVMDNGMGLFANSNSEEEQIDFVDQSGYLFGPSLTATLSNIPTALWWWCEEGKLLDGDSQPDCVVANASKVIDVLEITKAEEIALRKERFRKRMEEEELKKRKEEKKHSSERDDLPGDSEVASTSSGQPVRRSSNATGNADVASATESLAESIVESVLRPTLQTQPQPIDGPDFSELTTGLLSSLSEILPSVTAPQNLLPRQSAEQSLQTDAGSAPAATDAITTTTTTTTTTTAAAAAAAAPAPSPDAATTSAAATATTATAVPAASAAPPASVSEAEPELPEGVDPSFLAALPDEVREEVIAEQLRLQRLRQRAVQQSNEAAPISITEVNPEFLAALPPAIQEEVLAQQRMEQQRQAAATANPNDPVDAAAFFQNLQPSLRQAILTDMEDSQISVLPPDLAQEAQNLRREWEARNRQLMQERFFSHVSHNNSALSSILRNTGRVGSARYAIHTVPQRAQWNPWNSRPDPHPSLPLASHGLRLRGRQLLDHEALACLLVLLFLDEPKLNTARLHRVLRNLCYHGSTREWVIKALLSILDLCTEPKRDGRRKPQYNFFTTPLWLNVKMDTALGLRARVFNIGHHAGKRGSRSLETTGITVHKRAAPVIIRHTLEVLISLAKTFPGYFLPLKCKGSDKEASKDSNSKVRASTSSSASASGSPRSSKNDLTNFWDILLKLDSTTYSKKGKSVARSHCIPGPICDDEHRNHSFESSPFGQLMKMLQKFPGYGPTLVDKMLRLLSLISIGLPEINPYLRHREHAEGKKPEERDESVPVSKEYVRKIMTQLELQTCSEEGLEDATALLLNLSNCPDPTKEIIYGVLINGAISTANFVSQLLRGVQMELDDVNSSWDHETFEDKYDNSTNDHVISESDEDYESTDIEHFRSKETEVNADFRTEKQNENYERDNYGTLEGDYDFLQEHKVGDEDEERDDADYDYSNTNDNAAGFGDVDSFGDEVDVYCEDNGESDDNEFNDEVNIHKEENVNNITIDHVDHYIDGEDPEVTSGELNKGIVPDRFTNGTVVVSAPLKVKGCYDVFMPSLNSLTKRTSTQAFFLRMLKVIVQIRESVRMSRRSQENNDSNSTNSTNNTSSTNKSKDEDSVLPPLSQELEQIDHLWDTLSSVLTKLAETPDNHHAVMSLQPTVEAFFLVHSTAGEEQRSVYEGHQDHSEGTGHGVHTENRPPTYPEGREQINRSDFDPARADDTDPDLTRSPSYSPVHSPALVSNHVVLNEEYPNPSDAHNSPSPQTSQNSSSSSSFPNSSNLVSIPTFSYTAPLGVVPVSPLQPDADGSAGANAQQSPVFQNPLLETNTPPVTLNPDQQKFLRFAEKHRAVLNQILRQSTTHLADGPFAVLVDHTRVLDFDVKRKYFRSELERMDEGIRREELAVHVRRSHVFEDSFRELHRRTIDEWKNRFYIVFEGEEGQDAGGLLREWYVIISREIFNPMYALFTTSPGDRVTYMINPSSHCNPNHLCYFKFVGRVIAKAIYDNKLLECYFTRSFYKHILGIHVKHTDMESEDYSFYQGLVYLMEHHVSDLGYDLTFSAEVQEFGVTDVRDLIPNGRNIPVTESNKMDYIRLVCQMKMTGAIRKQINAFLEGFYDIIPKRLISIFNEQELELLISGMPNVDIEDLKANTEYHKYQPNSLQIQWFWRALRGFDQADRAKFLQFVTGTSKVPLQGFAALEGMNGVQKFQIHRDDRSTDRLPSAHTCFNQLDLPVYETYDKLRTYLLKAIHECSEGFGFA